MNSKRRELLDGLFSDSGSPPLDGLLNAIHQEKLRRAARQRALALTASFAALVAVAMVGTRFSNRSPFSKPPDITGVEGRTAAPLAQTPFQVERIDDEELLNLLEHTPTALVHWPNGKRGLMLLVQTAPPD